MKYIQVYALFLMLVFCTSCGGQNKADLPKENIKPETKDIVTFPGSNEKYHTKYEYTDSIGKRLNPLRNIPAQWLGVNDLIARPYGSHAKEVVNTQWQF